MGAPKPCFREQSGAWYVLLDGEQRNPGANQAAAFKACDRLLLDLGERAIGGVDTARNVLAVYRGWR